MKRKILFLAASALFAFSLLECKPKSPQVSGAPMLVFASILPQKYFIEKIGGEHVQVQVLVGLGKSPETYETTPQQVTALSNAKIFFTIGLPFEDALLPAIAQNISTLQIVDTSQGIVKRKLEGHAHDDGHDDAHKDHSHDAGMPDFHIWLSPTLVKTQAQNIYRALVQADSAHQADYQAGYNALIKELDDVNAELKKSFAPYKGQTIFVFHPAFGYLTDEFGLQQEAIETGGKEPVPSALEKIITEAKADGVKIVFVQSQFSQTAAKKIAQAIGGRVVEINPLSADYINNLKSIAAEMQKSFQ